MTSEAINVDLAICTPSVLHTNVRIGLSSIPKKPSVVLIEFIG